MATTLKKYLPWALASAGFWYITSQAKAETPPQAPNSQYLIPNAGTTYTNVNGQQVPMAGSVNILGVNVPYNLDPTYSPTYQQFLAGPVNQAAANQIASAPQTKNMIALGVLVTSIGLSVAYQVGRNS